MAHSELNGGLLIVTQVVDETDSVLGFFVSWIRRLAESGRPVTVFCWKAGTYSDLPKQVHVIVLPKGGLRRAFRIAVWSFTHRKNFSAVFVHMIPPVAAALGPVWRLLRKRVVLWYTHGSVSRTLKYSEWFVHTILTASDESCRINSRKKVVVGHGIDLEIFKPGDRAREPLLICVGRISRRKNQRAFIELCEQIHRAQPKLIFRGMIIGVPRTEEDFVY
ncbi:MAG TPA: hypothetical protein VFQ60_05560, partial [Patescibacteria group bacterium]|nr:hypothetical protein [Patescibacteria group bacterium]